MPGSFRRGADSFDEGAKIWLRGTINAKNLRKNRFSFPMGAIAPCPPLAPPLTTATKGCLSYCHIGNIRTFYGVIPKVRNGRWDGWVCTVFVTNRYGKHREWDWRQFLLRSAKNFAIFSLSDEFLQKMLKSTKNLRSYRT